jgi:tetratricopeptide (TPR) repeat protein
MRRILLSLTFVLANAGLARAGVYNLDEPRKYPSDFMQVNTLDPVKQVMIHLAELRAIDDRAVNPQFPAGPDSLRVAYEKQLAGLHEKRDALSDIDRVNLGACLIRMGRFNEARAALGEALRVVPADSPARFLLLLNLAAAYQEDNDLLQRAIDLQRQALRAWPRLWAGWNRWENTWYRHAEEYALTVMQLRQRELIRSQGRSAAEFPRYYELFPQVHFVGASGEYEAGGIAFEQVNRLPADAEMIVLQLLLWRPLDNQLYWLYGELLNVRGQVDWAFAVLDYLTSQLRLGNRELRQHQRILRESLPLFEKLFTDPTESGDNRRLQAALLWALAPRGTLGAPGIGSAANELGGAAAAAFAGMPSDSRYEPAPRGGAPAATSALLPDWRHITVSFLTGIVVAVLAALQWRQWRRPRRSAVPIGPPAVDSYSHRGEIVSPSSSYSRPADG